MTSRKSPRKRRHRDDSLEPTVLDDSAIANPPDYLTPVERQRFLQGLPISPPRKQPPRP